MNIEGETQAAMHSRWIADLQWKSRELFRQEAVKEYIKRLDTLPCGKKLKYQK